MPGPKRFILSVLLLVAASAPAAAQGIRVQVIDDRTREPIGGAIVSLLNAEGSSLREGLTSQTGHRLLAVPSAGEYRILVRRVGYVPVTSPPISVPADETIPYVMPVRGERVVLPSVVARARRECRTETAEVARTAVLWEEIRKALTASELARVDQYTPIQLRVFERELDDEGRTTKEEYSAWLTTSHTPFVAASPAELSRHGYLMRDDGLPVNLRALDLLEHDFVWHGPDAPVLLSPEFERDHCFQLVAGSGATAEAIGLAFEPVEDRQLPDIAGTLWVDRQTAELRFVEFDYVNTGLPSRIDGGSGRIQFRHLASGEWIVDAWVLRYPRLTVGRRGRDFRLRGFNEVGGEAEPARVGRVAGTAYDSLGGRPLVDARITVDDTLRVVTTGDGGGFEIDSLLPGTYTLRLRHPLLDSLGVGSIPSDVLVQPDEVTRRAFSLPSHRTFRSACTAGTGAPADSGMVAGTVYEAAGATIAGATISFTWEQPPVGSDTLPQKGILVMTSDDRGEFVACGLPVGPALRVRAEHPGPMPAEVEMRIGSRAIARLELVLRPRAPPTAGQPPDRHP